MNGDGKADVVFHNQTFGLVALWFMAVLTICSVGFPIKPSTDWAKKTVRLPGKSTPGHGETPKV